MPPKTVLIADDDADVLTALTLRCELLGLDVRLANDAMSALMMFHVDRPDVLIIDVNMPGGNGLSVCEMLRSDARHPDVPLIVLTGRADDETIHRCQDAGVHYVRKGGDIWDRIKPFLEESLRLKID
jgi:CheY-like chemotaxis protein